MEQTLQFMRDAGYGITGYCEAGDDCHHSADLDLDKLIERLGPDFPALATPLRQHLVCSSCGKKQMGIRISPPHGYNGRRR